MMLRRYRLESSDNATGSFRLIDLEKHNQVTEGYLVTGLDGVVRFEPLNGLNIARVISDYEAAGA
jgi:hypothetical protein